MHKKCSKCNIEKDFSEFWKRKNCKFGLYGRCISCMKKASKNYLEITKRYREKHRDMLNEKARQFYQQNKEKCIDRVIKSRAKHYDKYITYSKKYELQNKEARLKKSRDYAKNNPGKIATIALKRRLKQKKCTPVWADKDKINKIYKLRDRLNKMAGHTKYHVDHIIPLNAKLASGLHVINNLAIILASVNLSKRNDFNIMDDVSCQ